MKSEEREKRIVRDSILGIVVNLAIAAAKILMGVLTNSLAIISEGMNNAADAGSSFLTLVGTKLSNRHPDKDHPFGYGRIEYLTSLTVAILILYTGVALLRSSIDGILHPAELSVTAAAIALVAFSAAVKFLLGTFIIREGKAVESSALTGVGIEGRNDSIFSVVTIVVSILYLITGISLDAWVGILFAAVILKSGIDILRDTVSELIGRPGQKELATKLYREIRSTKGILNAADMMLHNYGPDSWSGSVNIEIDSKASIGDIYEFLHELQLSIMHKYHVTMVFGIYAVDEDRAVSREMRQHVNGFIRQQEHVISYHALYKSEKTGRIYCDIVVDYDLKDWEKLEEDFIAYMHEKYPENEVEVTIETEFV